MPVREAQLTINPLFHEALSGEFSAGISNPQTHTLGRLLVATFQKGKLVEDPSKHISGALKYDVRRSPSWAPEVTATVFCVEALHQSRAKELTLMNNSDSGIANRIIIGDVTQRGADEGKLRIVRPGTSEDEYLPLVLGNPLTHARNTIADIAREFFKAHSTVS